MHRLPVFTSRTGTICILNWLCSFASRTFDTAKARGGSTERICHPVIFVHYSGNPKLFSLELFENSLSFEGVKWRKNIQ